MQVHKHVLIACTRAVLICMRKHLAVQHRWCLVRIRCAVLSYTHLRQQRFMCHESFSAVLSISSFQPQHLL